MPLNAGGTPQPSTPMTGNTALSRGSLGQNSQTGNTVMEEQPPPRAGSPPSPTSAVPSVPGIPARSSSMLPSMLFPASPYPPSSPTISPTLRLAVGHSTRDLLTSATSNDHETIPDTFEDPDAQEHVAHAATFEMVRSKLETSLQKGLTTTEAEARLETFGKNALRENKGRSLLMRIFDQLNASLVYVMFVAAAIAGAFEKWAEFGLVLAVVVCNTIIGLYQEGKAASSAKALQGMLAQKANVVRDGIRKEVPADTLVPGDVVFIESGNSVPADLRLFSVTGLNVLEGMITGESKAVVKDTEAVDALEALGDRKCMAFSATLVTKGQGFGIVVSTGGATEIGKINTLVGEVKAKPTNMQIQIKVFGQWIAIVTLPFIVASFLLAYFLGDPPNQVGDSFIEATAIAVAIIPEGLPAVLTVALSIGMNYMASKNAIVKTLPAVETLGSVMVICSDKTGTLTKNEMTVVSVRTGFSSLPVEGVGYSYEGFGVGDLAPGQPHPEYVVMEMANAGSLCSDANLSYDEATKRPIPVGDPTEVALVTFAHKLGLDPIQLRHDRPRISVIPFESEHKFMATAHLRAGITSKEKLKYVMYVKGAPDRLIPRCAFQLGPGGEELPLDEEFWEQAASDMSANGWRCIALCREYIAAAEQLSIKGPDMILGEMVHHAKTLTILGIVGILDPPREECIPAIKEAHTAGITVKMITGDHAQTALAIAKKLSIADDDHSMVKTGRELDALTEAEIDAVVMKCNVFARASPENKIQIVEALQRNGQVCSMTGDGVNDAPALKCADIGVAMGITGTDVSKAAAKIVLTDDNFATIVLAVREGRRVWTNIRKILIFSQPINFAQGLTVFFALALQFSETPLTAISILYVNLVTAVTLGVAVALEPSEPNTMLLPPKRKDAKLVGKMFLWRCFFVGCLMVLFNLLAFRWVGKWADDDLKDMEVANGGPLPPGTVSEKYPPPKQRAVTMTTLILMEVAYSLNCRFLQIPSIHHRVFFGNIWTWLCSLILIVLQCFILYTPGVESFFGMAPMDGPMWGIAIMFAAAIFFIIELEKALIIPFVRPYVNPCLDRFFVKCRRCMKCQRKARPIKTGAGLRLRKEDLVGGKHFHEAEEAAAHAAIVAHKRDLEAGLARQASNAELNTSTNGAPALPQDENKAGNVDEKKADVPVAQKADENSTVPNQ